MRRLLASTYKEFLLIIRDAGGLAILFIMPLVLVVTITLIQDSSFKTIKDTKIPVLFVDNDKGDVSKTIKENLGESQAFEIVTQENNTVYTEETAREAVNKGQYQLAVVIPEKLSEGLQNKVSQNVGKILSELGVEEESDSVSFKEIPHKEIKLYFDPASQKTFKDAVMNGIDKMIAKIESQSIYRAFQDELSTDGDIENPLMQEQNFISFKEINPGDGSKEIIPNSTQHNVPAWTLFAIFFIVVPLSINIVKEKSQGTFVRLRTNPVSYATVLGGKTILFLIISIIQYLLMLAVGVFLFPKFDLAGLEIASVSSFLLSLVVAIFSGLAAIGFGTLLGTIANTQEQSAPFGATAVVILAAIGGVWVPVFIMPKIMQVVSHFSPMNWGLSAFYDVFLRNGSFVDILPEIGLLFLFFLATMAIAIAYDKKKRSV